MTKSLFAVSDLPNTPAVYAMYGGHGRRLFVAYVGVAKELKKRIEQHLVRRDSSIVTGASATGLNPDCVTEVGWWEHPDFDKRHVLEAAELVAFDILEPALRSRGSVQKASKRLYDDATWQENMRLLFSKAPIGNLVILTLSDAFEKIVELENRVAMLESILLHKSEG